MDAVRPSFRLVRLFLAAQSAQHGGLVRPGGGVVGVEGEGAVTGDQRLVVAA